MAYMKDSTGRRLDSIRVPSNSEVLVPGHIANITSRLDRDAEDACLLVVGDSTGNETWEWVYLLTQWLGTQYPRFTVTYYIWNDTGQVYDAPVTVQTGTGTHSLKVYNCSVSGKDASYPTTRMATISPTTPQVVIVNYGHNSTSGEVYRIAHYALTRQLEDWFPLAGIVCCNQNPRTDAEAPNGWVRNRVIQELCASEGYGCIDITQAFASVANWQGTLINVDGLHPNAAGQQVWLGAVRKHFDAARLTQPFLATRRPHRIFVPASAMLAHEGAPVYGKTGAIQFFESWQFDPTTPGGVLATVDIPDWWASVNAYVLWSWQSASGYTGLGCRFEFHAGRFPTGTNPFSSPASGVDQSLGGSNYSYVGGATSTPQNGGAYGAKLSRVASAYSLTGRPWMVAVRRVTDHASDLLAEPVYFRGLIIERAS